MGYYLQKERYIQRQRCKNLLRSFLTNDFERNLKHEHLDYHPTYTRELKDTAMGNNFYIMVCVTETVKG